MVLQGPNGVLGCYRGLLECYRVWGCYSGQGVLLFQGHTGILQGFGMVMDGQLQEHTYTVKSLGMMRIRLAPKDLTAWSAEQSEHSRFRC